MKRKGIILAGGTGSRLYPLTFVVSKQLMPVYDKPMIYYALSVLMLTGIREVLVISTPVDRPLFERMFGDGSSLGLKLAYAEQPRPEGIAQAFLIGADFLGGAPSALVLGDNLFYGHDFVKCLHSAHHRHTGATIFAYHVANPSAYGVVEFADNSRVLSIEEKPAAPKSPYAIPGLYFYDQEAVRLAQQLKPSGRGELEISDLNRLYLLQDKLYVERLGRGIAWLDTGTPAALLDAAQFVQVVQSRQGLMIACLEEIAYQKGWIDRGQLKAQISRYGASPYGRYLSGLLNR